MENQKIDLEEMLKKIEDFKKNLIAEIVIQEEEGHWGPPHRKFHTEERGCYDADEAVWEVTKPKIAKPDIQKIETTKVKLQEIYNSSEWYCIKYMAGKALGVNKEELNAKFEKWLNELNQKLKAETTISGVYEKTYISPFSATDSLIVRDERPFINTKPDELTRKLAREDLKCMYDLLPEESHRKMAGKALGYSSLRIWLHELFR